MFEDNYRGKKVLVTGHTGFKGSWLALWLHSLGAELSGLALDAPTTPSLYSAAGVGDLLDDHRVDIRDFETLAGVVRQVQPEIVFHLAAQAIVRRSYAEPKETFDTNVGGTVNVLEALRDCSSVRAVVVITSDKCYENREWVHPYRETDPLGGHDPYSASKAATEVVTAAYARSFFDSKGVAVATTRAGNVIGGGDWAADRIIPDAIRAFASAKPVPVRNPRSIRPWQHVLEPLSGYLLLGARLMSAAPAAGAVSPFVGAWNFAPPTESCRPVRDLVERFIDAYGSGSWEDLSAHQKQAPHEAQLLTLSWQKAHYFLNWRPRWDFATAVRRTSLWYRRHSDGADARALCLEDIQAYSESE